MALPVIRIRNEQGKIQFMSEGIQYQFVSKGVAYTTTDRAVRVGNTGPSTVLIPVSAGWKDQLIAVRSSFTIAKWGVYDRAGNGVYTAYYSCDTPSAGQPVEYWIFEPATNLNTSGVGLKLRNPTTNEVIYNSNHDSLRVAGVVSPGVQPSTSFTAGKKYAAIYTTVAGYNQSGEGLYKDGVPYMDNGEQSYGTWTRQNDGKLLGGKWTNETLEFGIVSFDDVIVQAPGYAYEPDPPTVWWDNPMGNVLVIDVSAL